MKTPFPEFLRQIFSRQTLQKYPFPGEMAIEQRGGGGGGHGLAWTIVSKFLHFMPVKVQLKKVQQRRAQYNSDDKSYNNI